MGMDISIPGTHRNLLVFTCYAWCFVGMIGLGAAQWIQGGSEERLTFCGRAVSLEDGLVPAEGIVGNSEDPIMCLKKPGGFRSAEGLAYANCVEQTVVLEPGVQIPVFSVEIGNLTGHLMAHLEPGHVRSICMSSIFLAQGQWVTGQALSGFRVPSLVCFHLAEPAASFLLRTCDGDNNCENHFFLASTGSCNEPTAFGVGGTGLTVAGLPSMSTGSVAEIPPNPVPKGDESTPKESGGKVEKTTEITYCARSLSLPEDGSPQTDAGITPSDDPIKCTMNPGLIKNQLGPSFTACRTNRVMLKVSDYTPIYEVKIGDELVRIEASIVNRGDAKEMCLNISSRALPVAGSGNIAGQPCFQLGRPAALFLTRTCHEKVCTDHYFLAVSGNCPSGKGQGRKMFQLDVQPNL